MLLREVEGKTSNDGERHCNSLKETVLTVSFASRMCVRFDHPKGHNIADKATHTVPI